MAKLWIIISCGIMKSINCLMTAIKRFRAMSILYMSLFYIPVHGGGNKSTYWISFEDIKFGVHAAQKVVKFMLCSIRITIFLILVNIPYFNPIFAKTSA